MSKNSTLEKTYELYFWTQFDRIFLSSNEKNFEYLSEIIQNISQFWRGNSNMSKSKVLSKLNFWPDILRNIVFYLEHLILFPEFQA